MPFHLTGVQDLVNAHQAADDVANRCALGRIRNACMFDTSGVELQEVFVLSEQDSPLGGGKFQMLIIGSSQQSSLRGRDDIRALSRRPLTTALATCSSV